METWQVEEEEEERAGERLPKLGDMVGVFKFLFFQTGYKNRGERVVVTRLIMSYPSFVCCSRSASELCIFAGSCFVGCVLLL